MANFSSTSRYHRRIEVPFLPRDAMRISAVFVIARCPSVYPSNTFAYCIQTAEDIVKLLSRSSSHIFLVFDSEHCDSVDMPTYIFI